MLTPSGPPGEETPPNDGLLFISYGNYGSTVYDPLDGGQEYLLVVICDECAVAQAREQKVMHICRPVPVPRPRPRYRGPWIPEEDTDASQEGQAAVHQTHPPACG